MLENEKKITVETVFLFNHSLFCGSFEDGKHFIVYYTPGLEADLLPATGEGGGGGGGVPPRAAHTGTTALHAFLPQEERDYIM